MKKNWAARGERMASLIKPNRIKIFPDHLLINQYLARIIFAAGWPRIIKLGFLDPLIRAKGNFDISMHIRPLPRGAMCYKLKKLITKQRADLYSAERSGREAESLRILHDDTVKLLRKIERGEESVFDLSMYINVKGRDKEGLESETKKIKAELDGIGIIGKQPTFRMLDGLRSVMPVADDRLSISRTLTSTALAECFPFTSTYMTVDPAGIIFGINQATNVPIIRDIFGFMNPNVLVVGGSGSGKSYFTKLMLSRYVMRGVHVSIIDPSGEYTNIVRALGGERIELSSRSNSMINPLDLLGYDLDEKLLSLADLFEIIFGKMSPEQKSALMDAAIETYKRFGITVDMTKTAKKKRIKQPTLGDLYKTMLELRIDKSTLSAIKPYVEGALSFLNCHTKLKLDANPISFNLRDLPKAARPLVMHIILDYIYSRMRTSLGKKMLVVDEAWSLLRHARTRGDVPFLLEIVKTSRKFNLSLTLLVQEINDLIKSDAGEAILANTSCKFFFRQDSAVIKPLAERLGLNLHERRLLLSAGVGEGLLIADEERIPIRVIASRAEHKLITTKPGEISG